MPRGQNKIDMINKTFGLLTVVNELPTRAKDRSVVYRCRCACGNWVAAVKGNTLRSGHTTSCGCEQKRKASEASRTHGLCKDKDYFRWNNIKNRTTNPNCKDYRNYGGRGIRMHHTWIEAGKGFERFKWYLDTVLGPCPEGYTLDRIDNDAGYEPRNLRWATRKQQTNNRRPQRSSK